MIKWLTKDGEEFPYVLWWVYIKLTIGENKMHHLTIWEPRS